MLQRVRIIFNSSLKPSEVQEASETSLCEI